MKTLQILFLAIIAAVAIWHFHQTEKERIAKERAEIMAKHAASERATKELLDGAQAAEDRLRILQAGGR